MLYFIVNVNFTLASPGCIDRIVAFDKIIPNSLVSARAIGGLGRMNIIFLPLIFLPLIHHCVEVMFDLALEIHSNLIDLAEFDNGP